MNEGFVFSVRILIVVALIVSTLSHIRAEEAVSPELINGVFSDNAAQRERAHQAILAMKGSLNTDARTNLIHGLIKGIEDAEKEKDLKKEESIRRAILILGEMPEKKSIEALVARIAFPEISPALFGGYPSTGRGGSHRVGAPWRELCPAVDILIKIGEPCLPRVIEKLAIPHGSAEVSACRAVLVGVKGRAGAQALLRDAAAKEKDPKKQKRLELEVDEIAKPLGGVEEPATSK